MQEMWSDSISCISSGRLADIHQMHFHFNKI
jgi:hypothetical protein